MEGDSEGPDDALVEVETRSVEVAMSDSDDASELTDVVGSSSGADAVCDAAVDAVIVSIEYELSISETDALALDANALGVWLSIDWTVDEVYATGSVGDALGVSDDVAEDDGPLDEEAAECIAGVFVEARALNDAIGAFAGVDDGDEGVDLQLPKPDWQPVPQ
jgi:hypothetical protein